MKIYKKGILFIKKLIYPYIYRIFPIKKCIKRDTNIRVIISLTSYSMRLSNVDICVRSLLRQSEMPDIIVLYLGNDVSNEMIPQKLKRLQKYGLKIKMNYDNIRPHKKYFYAMQEYDNSIIITVDDDAIYDKDLVKSLLLKHKEYPHVVISRTTKRITKANGVLLPYKKWEYLASDEKTLPGKEYLAVGVGGTLYPAKCLPDLCFDKALLKKLSMNADDLWLKFMELINDISVVHCESDYFVPIPIERKQKKGLFVENVLHDKNDEIIKNLQTALGVDLVRYGKDKNL